MKITSEISSLRNPTAFWEMKVNVLDFEETRLRTCRWTGTIWFCRTMKKLCTSDFLMKKSKNETSVLKNGVATDAEVFATQSAL